MAVDADKPALSAADLALIKSEEGPGDAGSDTTDATGDKGSEGDKGGDTADKTIDAAGDKTGDKAEGKDTADAKDGKGKDEASLLDDEAAADDADADKSKSDAKDGKDKKPASDWEGVRARAIDREMKRQKTQLSKKFTAAELPKELAKQRKALENVLGRAASIEDALIAGYNAQQKIRSGQYRAPLSEDATEEERAEDRKARGIPEEAKAYDIPKIPGHEWTEADTPVLDGFKEAAFKADLTQAQMNQVTGWYAKQMQAAKEARAEQLIEIDRSDVKAGREVLRDHLGEGEYKPSISLMKRYLEDEEVFPDGVGQLLAGARFEDGRKVVNNPAIAKFLIETARNQYGEGALLSGSAAAAVTDERDELVKLMNTDIDKYNNETWRNTGQTGSQRLYELNKKAEGRRGKAA